MHVIGDFDAVDVVKDGVVDSSSDPLRQVTIELFRQEEMREPAILPVPDVGIDRDARSIPG